MMKKKHIYFDIPIEDRAICLKDIYLKLEFDMKHKAASTILYVDSDRVGVVYLVPIALFINPKCTSSCQKKCSKCYNYTPDVQFFLKCSKNIDDVPLVFNRVFQLRGENWVK